MTATPPRDPNPVVLAEMREFATSLTTAADAAVAPVTPGAVLHPAPGVDLSEHAS